ncbi:DUF262 domain-containing protein [Oceanicaulis sp. LC35]|uniref:GmrSD restriction endonuclease domain-containing protein n=1 Tax=Oceanicaulis sp. LC35 TaxID=3349635 RepID=UPI003F86403A
MSGSVVNYIKLVEDAKTGKVKLPAFQREFKWQRKQVILLFDSVRQGYPLNGMIQIEGGDDDFQARPFYGADSDAEHVSAGKLILDGQQRITAGIHLYFNDNIELKSQYFVDLDRLSKAFNESGYDIESESDIKAFVSELDVDAGYLKARTRTENPYSLLCDKHLLFTPLLLGANSRKRETYFDDYLDKYPDRKPLIRNIINGYFLVSVGPSIPIINIESEFKLDAVSRIFATLNSSGKVLTPFELVVAVLFPKNIDLRKDIAQQREKLQYYPNMDKTGEIVLQTAVLLAGNSPKKSLLPKTLTAEIWEQFNAPAFEGLEAAGAWLTKHLGMALDLTPSLIPYDSIFAPLVKVMDDIGYSAIPGDRVASVNVKLKRWVVGSAISQRYQEGVHNKQELDSKTITQWIKGLGPEPEWLTSVRVPSLISVIPTGAIGKMMRALLNREKTRDPVNQEEINVGSSVAQLHHIFPTKFVDKLSGWDKGSDNSNRLLNTMQLHQDTNKRFLDDDPIYQVEAAEQANPDYRSSYAVQGISEQGLLILRQPQKSKSDFRDFMKLRESYFEKLLEELGFDSGGARLDEDDEDEA